LSASDASFYQLENTSTPMYVGSLSILRKPRRLPYDALLETVERRLPRFRGIGRRSGGHSRAGAAGVVRHRTITCADPRCHRRAATQLHELIARLGSRPLDRSRPLWEMYLIEGLAKNRLALHQDPSGPGQRHDRAGDRPRRRRSLPAAAAVR
jgi:hypothetical protein